MRLQTQVNEQGILTIQMPPSFRRQVVNVSIAPVLPSENAEARLAWQQIRQTLRRTNELDFPRKSHDEIITQLREFREAP